MSQESYNVLLDSFNNMSVMITLLDTESHKEIVENLESHKNNCRKLLLNHPYINNDYLIINKTELKSCDCFKCMTNIVAKVIDKKDETTVKDLNALRDEMITRKGCITKFTGFIETLRDNEEKYNSIIMYYKTQIEKQEVKINTIKIAVIKEMD